MKEEKFLEVFGNIDDKFIEEANTVLKSSAKKSWIKLVGIAASLLIVSGVVLFVLKVEGNKNPDITSPTTYWEETNGTAPQNLTPTEVALTEATDGNSTCGGLGEINVDNVCIHIDGVDYWVTDEIGYDFLSENYESIKTLLIESGVNADNLLISEHGYSHLNTDDNTIAVNYRDYLAYSDGELISIITVINDENGLWYSPAFGGPWFEQYNSFLNEHSGEELVYLYVGIPEVIITPDNELYYASSGQPYGDVVDGVDYYAIFNQGSNTYIP